MKIPDNKKYLIYIAVAKTASSSLRSFFSSVFNTLGYKDLTGGKECRPASMILLAPDQTLFLKNEFPALWEDSFKIGSVRNPYDRFVSAFLYHPFCKSKSPSEVLNNLPTPAVLPQYIKWKEALPEPYWSLYSAYNHLTASQSDVLLYESNEMPDFLIRFESLNQDLSKLLELLRIEHPPPLPHLNPTQEKKDPYSSYLSASEINLINNKFSDDFMNFNYPTISS